MNNDTTMMFMDAMSYAMEGENPSKAIENQERRGQQSVVIKQRLPRKLNSLSVPDDIRWNGVEDSMEYEERNKIVTQNNIQYTKQQYEKMGIVIVDEYDDLFYNVELPEGWQIKATDHSMWNNLVDNKGRKRAQFFYKAAFYDRDAFINFNTRFHVDVEHTAPYSSDYDVWAQSDYQGTIKDGEDVIFSTECVPVTGSYTEDDKVKDALRKKLDEYMDENYPNYTDINAYWD